MRTQLDESQVLYNVLASKTPVSSVEMQNILFSVARHCTGRRWKINPLDCKEIQLPQLEDTDVKLIATTIPTDARIVTVSAYSYGPNKYSVQCVKTQNNILFLNP